MKKLCLLVVLSFVLSCFQTASAQDIYLKIPNYTNNASIVKGYEDYAEITSLQLGFTNPVTTTGGGGAQTSRVNVTEITLTKNTDLATTKLTKALLMGSTLREAEIVVVVGGGQTKPTPKYKLNLTDVRITGYSTSASSGCGECPAESLSLAYETITITTYIQNAKGQITTSVVKYDLNTRQVE